MPGPDVAAARPPRRPDVLPVARPAAATPPSAATRRGVGLTAVALAGLLAGCTGGADDGSGGAAARPAASAVATPRSTVTLPPDALARFVPSGADVPAGLLPVVSGSGPRDLAAVAGFSGDPTSAAAALRAHGFRRAYVAQYAEQGGSGRVLSVVVAEFATLPGAADDLAADVAAAGPAERADVGQGGSLATSPLPGGGGTLTTLRFRVGTRTWLLAAGAPEADRAGVLALGRLLAERAEAA